MSSLVRGVRNAVRKPARLAVVVLLVGLALGLALTMAAARSALSARADEVRSTVGTTLTVSDAQSGGFGGGGGGFFRVGGGQAALDQANLTFIEGVPHVSWVRYDLVSFADAGNTSLKAPDFGGGGGGFRTGGGRGGSFTPPTPTFGTTRFDSLGTNAITLAAGTTPDKSSAQPAALLGQEVADANNLTVGGTFQLHGQAVAVSGVITGGNFAGRAVVLPLATLQGMTGNDGRVSSATVRVDAIDNVAAVQQQVQAQLGDQADVTSGEQAASAAAASLNSIGSVATTSLVVCAAAAAATVVLVMVLVARERRREIGTLKAIGAPTASIVAQFAAESVAFTALALVAALAFAGMLHGTVASWLGTQATGGGGGGGFGPGGGGGFRGGLASSTLAGLHVSPGLLGIGAAAALLLGVVGSVGPALLIAHIRPAAILRGA
jgi:putative ABC transport system permease protein